MKKHLTTLSIILTLTITSFGQDSTVYVAKARLFGHIMRYTCTELILRNDSTYHFEEIADDLILDIANGRYEFKSDTIYLLRNDDFPTIKYIYKENKLICLNKYKLGKKLKKIIVH